MEKNNQINSGLFERLLLSNDKDSVMAVARNERLPELPHEIVKDPMIFWGIRCLADKLRLKDSQKDLQAKQN